jgi:hypothetical protein
MAFKFQVDQRAETESLRYLFFRGAYRTGQEQGGNGALGGQSAQGHQCSSPVPDKDEAGQDSSGSEVTICIHQHYFCKI